ncbi:MAG TPA: hypothetical protein PLM79_07665 [Syntrophobacteraceae bacterium]|nr:hypothetical protein [Syntrophobacteraceae bacterium]
MTGIFFAGDDVRVFDHFVVVSKRQFGPWVGDGRSLGVCGPHKEKGLTPIGGNALPGRILPVIRRFRQLPRLPIVLGGAFPGNGLRIGNPLGPGFQPQGFLDGWGL